MTSSGHVHSTALRFPAVLPAGDVSAKKVSGPTLGDRFFEAYKRFCYRALGRRFDLTPRPHLLLRLRQAGYAMTPGLFEAMLVVTTLIAWITADLLMSALLIAVVHARLWFIEAIILSGVTALATAAAFPFVLGARINNRKNLTERELPFSLSELAVLASIGLSPIELVRRMSQRPHDQAMTGEFKRVVYKADMQGRDLITALSETAKESPSSMIRQTFWDLASMMHQGGDLDAYLRAQSEDVLVHRRASQKQFIDQLGTYADIYITVVLIGIMFVGVGIFLLDSFGMTAGGISAGALLQLLAYGFVPLVVVTLGIILSSAHQRHE
jgi:archaellum biogenesis protein FlaJ (TadC family)